MTSLSSGYAQFKESAMSTTSDLIEELTRERAALLEIVEGLDDATLDRKGVVGAWSIKNVLAHLAAWEAVVVGITPEWLATRVKPQILQASTADEDADNAEQVGLRERLLPADQFAELETTRGALLHLFEDLGDETLARRNPWPEWEGTLAEYFVASICEHEREHRNDVRAAVTIGR
jgi:DinB superfamily